MMTDDLQMLDNTYKGVENSGFYHDDALQIWNRKLFDLSYLSAFGRDPCGTWRGTLRCSAYNSYPICSTHNLALISQYKTRKVLLIVYGANKLKKPPWNRLLLNKQLQIIK